MSNTSDTSPKLVIVSDAPDCILGYYRPFDSPEEAADWFNEISGDDPTARLVHRSDAQLMEILRRLITTPSNEDKTFRQLKAQRCKEWVASARKHE